MGEFILTDIVMVSLGAMLYLLARSLPRIHEDEPEESKPTLIERWIMSEIPHKIDRVVTSYSGKTFRKLKVVLLKFDNYLTNRLKTMGTSDNGKPKIDFNDIHETEDILPVKKKE
jgi:hypothetical protein